MATRGRGTMSPRPSWLRPDWLTTTRIWDVSGKAVSAGSGVRSPLPSLNSLRFPHAPPPKHCMDWIGCCPLPPSHPPPILPPSQRTLPLSHPLSLPPLGVAQVGGHSHPRCLEARGRVGRAGGAANPSPNPNPNPDPNPNPNQASRPTIARRPPTEQPTAWWSPSAAVGDAATAAAPPPRRDGLRRRRSLPLSLHWTWTARARTQPPRTGG